MANEHIRGSGISTTDILDRLIESRCEAYEQELTELQRRKLLSKKQVGDMACAFKAGMRTTLNDLRNMGVYTLVEEESSPLRGVSKA